MKQSYDGCSTKLKTLLTAFVFLLTAVNFGAHAQGFATVTPPTLQLTLVQDESSIEQVSITIDPLCVRPFNVDVIASDPNGLLVNQTGVLVNNCGGDTSTFDVTITGTGTAQAYDLQFVDVDSGSVLASIPVTISPSQAVGNVTPTSLEPTLGQGQTTVEQVSITIDPLCVRPFNVDVIASDPNGLLVNQTGVLVNNCGGDTSTFDVTITGTGTAQAYDLQFVDVDSGSVLGSIPVTITPPRPCTLDVALGMRRDELTIDFNLGTLQPADLNLYLSAYNNTFSILAAPIAMPVIDPPLSISTTIPAFPDIDNIGILATIATAEDGIICSAWQTIDSSPGN